MNKQILIILGEYLVERVVTLPMAMFILSIFFLICIKGIRIRYKLTGRLNN